MPNADKTTLVHVIASVNMTDKTGEILYVNPSNVKSSSAAYAGMPSEDVALVMYDAAGVEIGRVAPEVRFEACTSDHDEHEKIGLIQQDVELAPGLARIDLLLNGQELDRFVPAPATAAAAVGAAMGLGQPTPGREHIRAFGAEGVEPDTGVTYLIQAKPDTAQGWQTLSVGQKSPKFSIDKNQFPGAKSVKVRVIQHAGFERRTVDEREISLE